MNIFIRLFIVIILLGSFSPAYSTSLNVGCLSFFYNGKGKQWCLELREDSSELYQALVEVIGQSPIDITVVDGHVLIPFSTINPSNPLSAVLVKVNEVEDLSEKRTVDNYESLVFKLNPYILGNKFNHNGQDLFEKLPEQPYEYLVTMLNFFPDSVLNAIKDSVKTGQHVTIHKAPAFVFFEERVNQISNNVLGDFFKEKRDVKEGDHQTGLSGATLTIDKEGDVFLKMGGRYIEGSPHLNISVQGLSKEEYELLQKKLNEQITVYQNKDEILADIMDRTPLWGLLSPCALTQAFRREGAAHLENIQADAGIYMTGLCTSLCLMASRQGLIAEEAQSDICQKAIYINNTLCSTGQENSAEYAYKFFRVARYFYGKGDELITDKEQKLEQLTGLIASGSTTLYGWANSSSKIVPDNLSDSTWDDYIKTLKHETAAQLAEK